MFHNPKHTKYIVQTRSVLYLGYQEGVEGGGRERLSRGGLGIKEMNWKKKIDPQVGKY